MPRSVLVVVLGLFAVGMFVSRSVCVAASHPDTPLRPATGTSEPRVAQVLGSIRVVRTTDAPLTEISPSIFDLGSDRVTFTWVTREESIGRVRLATESDPIERAEPLPVRYHKLSVDGLRPGTHHAYEIDGRFSGSFETARLGAPFRFVVFGHPGGTHAAAAYPVSALASRLDDLNPAFALCTGDLCYNSSDASFEELYFDIFGDFLARRPIYVAPGNHEAGFPSSEGLGFTVFRRLFPYEFGSDDYAYHSFIKGNIEFFACAYGGARPGKFQAQIDWLKRGLAGSRSEFRVVYLGGAQNPMGFDRELFFRTAAEGGADLVFGGDGLGVHVTEEQGLDFFFAGTSTTAPRHFFMVQTEPYRLEVTQYAVPMSKLEGSWIFETRRHKETVFDARLFGRKGREPGAALFGPLSLDSDSFDGIELHVHNPFKKTAVIWLRWAPKRLVRPRGDYHYREEARRVLPGETVAFHYSLPATLPRTGKPWTLGEVEVRIGGLAIPDDFDMTEHVVQLTAFVDPLSAETASPAIGAPR